ncbi:MAG: major membrane immunogen (membrane-anchored lipoprotein), partial [Cyclobacteriaceae bacterium]
MKFLTKIFTLIGMSFLIACSEDDMGQFTVVNNISASSSTDGIINVSFEINSAEGVLGFSLAVIKTAQSSIFTASDFLELDGSQTFQIQANQLNYAVELNVDQLDTDGDVLASGNAYSIVVYNSELNYLSTPSASFNYNVEQFATISSFSANEEFAGADISRITVSFQANSSKGVEAFWVIVAKSQPVNQLLSNYINTLDNKRYTSIAPSLDNVYACSINEQQLDTDGHRLIDGSLYKIYVYAKGLEILSSASSVKKFDQMEVFSTVTDMWLHDISNNNNASDIRVLFDVNASRGIDHLSIALVKEESAADVSAASLATLSESAFTRISTDAKKSFMVDLNAKQTDIEGSQLEYDQKYTVLVFSDEMG